MKIFKGGSGFTIIVQDGDRTYRLRPKGLFSTGFCWGRGQPCASETALRILTEVVGYKKAMLLHTLFKWEIVVKKLRGSRWILTEDQIKEWVKGKDSYLRKTSIAGDLL